MYHTLFLSPCIFQNQFVADVSTSGRTKTASLVVDTTNTTFLGMQGGTFIVSPDNNGMSDANTEDGIAE